MAGISSATSLSVLGSKETRWTVTKFANSPIFQEDTNNVMLVSLMTFETEPFVMIQTIPNDV